ncbi:hypothetical protein CHGG_03414 [Chaetomium globosum CBS 148.51]|uniref:Riboflavin kinase n=1 Tax=Chaetomium globosum (strain ATCC 6205 / CBS 148.51 / DSM 1962 / NBRC 6347 / NRRL 1970) TaxID=306901 RepID=Q2H8P0_CHAGB|nr:uncharacterized protein CHGG_03414 [Chaetomium globosum CBS 148.51]EAQ91479.1 hypothetical protein CHGG_03414 [Chaetomium globosum CBS 148.51]
MEAATPLQIRRKPINENNAIPAPQSLRTGSSYGNTPVQQVTRLVPGNHNTTAPTSPITPDRDLSEWVFEEKPPPLPTRPRPQLEQELWLGVQPPARPVSRGAEAAEPQEPLLQIPRSHGLRPQKSMPELSRLGGFAPNSDSSSPSPFDAHPSTPAATFGPGASAGAGKKTFVQTALTEARHFAGGLIPHPTESTKHYTILRHSPALIFYRGPSTSVEMTIFSSPDHPLPADRTLWLQQRGYSGDSGMKIKAFFNATDSWLHVTPSNQVEIHQLAADTDRAWQRDIGKAAKKLLKEKGPKKAHIVRETHVIRVPEASDDGYFRLILCTGKGVPNEIKEGSSRCQTLCTSPIFRVASTSTDSSVFRGASLSTMPLEMGLYVASMVATTTVNKYTAPVRAPVEGVMNKVRPGFITETVGGFVRDELSDRSAERDAERDQAYFAAHQAHVARSLTFDPNVIFPIGPDSGPEPPFPLQFQGRVVPGTGRSQAELGIPTANLADVPDEIRYRLNGVYFGWAQVLPAKNKTRNSTQGPPASIFDPIWHEAIITVTPHNPSAAPSVTSKPLVTAHLLNFPPPPLPNIPTPNLNTPPPTLTNHTLHLLPLGLLHPLRPPTPTTTPTNTNLTLDTHARDTCLTLVSLARPNWRPTSPAVQAALDLQQAEKGIAERVRGVAARSGRRCGGRCGGAVWRAVW